MKATVPEPDWWEGATTVSVNLLVGEMDKSQFDRTNVDLLPYGVSITGSNTGDWPTQVISWSAILAIVQIS